MAKTLLDGFKKFRKKQYESPEGRMKQLVEEGQNPSHFIISCIDSRSNPGTIFGTPGMFFAHKAMGAIVRPYQKGRALSAALQFALHHNNVDTLIVLGHTGCGAIKAMIEEIDDDEITSFINVAKDGLKDAKKAVQNKTTNHDLQRTAEEKIVLHSVCNLEKYPSVAKALKEKRVTIKAWIFEMETGHICEYNEETGNFEKLTSKKGLMHA